MYAFLLQFGRIDIFVAECTCKQILAYVLCHCFQFDAPLWDDVSDAAKDLVQRMLTVDHTQRITIQDVLNHRWIRVSCILLRVSVAD